MIVSWGYYSDHATVGSFGFPDAETGEFDTRDRPRT